MKQSNISKTTTYHYVKFAFRTLLLLAAVALYIVCRVHGADFDALLLNFTSHIYVAVIFLVIWGIFVLEMLLRFFPSRIESMGCQKQFKRNYVPKEPAEKPERQEWWRTFLVFASWIALNSVFVTLYFTDIIDGGILILISLFYSVCDMICILFFCPFQTWMMKNRCCVSCRIYNWDYAMMFTPVAFIKNAFCISIFLLAAVLLVEWEILYRKFPQRFCRNTNESLSCANCKEKLCKHKKQLQSFIKKINIIDKRKNGN